MSFVYLCSPYTPINGESVQPRVDAACKFAAVIMREGHAVFSPIAHSHYIADHLDEATRVDHEFWMQQDLAILRHCQRVVVLCLPGWDTSKGIERELAAARRLNIPVEYRQPGEIWKGCDA